MKSVQHARCESLLILIALFVGLECLFKPSTSLAQQSSKNGEANSTPKANSLPRKFVREFDGKPYPVFNLYEVVERLTDAMDDLIKQDRLMTSVQLKKELRRTECKLVLPKPLTKELRSDELFLHSAESVFLVAGMTRPTKDDKSWKTAFSTAFVVHEEGILSTSAHVFDHDDADDGVVVMDKNGDVFPILEILAANRNADTCLFRIAKKGLVPLPLGTDRPPGTSIHVMGHPGDSFFFFSAGHISNYETDEEDATWLNITADFGQGSSGGPVMDSKGNVVGQVSRTYTLFAGGEATNRQRRRTTRKQNDSNPAPDEKDPDQKDKDADQEGASEKKSDPQMVFKSCTPVSAIRDLIK